MKGLARLSPERRHEIAVMGGKASKPKPRSNFTELELETYQLWLDGMTARQAGERIGKSHQQWINLTSSIARYKYNQEKESGR